MDRRALPDPKPILGFISQYGREGSIPNDNLKSEEVPWFGKTIDMSFRISGAINFFNLGRWKILVMMSPKSFSEWVNWHVVVRFMSILLSFYTMLSNHSLMLWSSFWLFRWQVPAEMVFFSPMSCSVPFLGDIMVICFLGFISQMFLFRHFSIFLFIQWRIIPSWGCFLCQAWQHVSNALQLNYYLIELLPYHKLWLLSPPTICWSCVFVQWSKVIARWDKGPLSDPYPARQEESPIFILLYLADWTILWHCSLLSVCEVSLHRHGQCWNFVPWLVWLRLNSSLLPPWLFSSILTLLL